MTHRQEAARETRRKIIEAGLALVRSGGFGAVSVGAALPRSRHVLREEPDILSTLRP